MAAVVAAAMSTLDGVILVMGAAASNDLYKGCINPNASDKTVLRITQAVMFIVLGLLAIITIGGVGTQITFLATFSHTMMASDDRRSHVWRYVLEGRQHHGLRNGAGLRRV